MSELHALNGRLEISCLATIPAHVKPGEQFADYKTYSVKSKCYTLSRSIRNSNSVHSHLNETKSINITFHAKKMKANQTKKKDEKCELNEKRFNRFSIHVIKSDRRRHTQREREKMA